MTILATGVTKVSGKAADTSGEVVLTAADIQNVVSPVSSGGIIERGSNANGEYVKFADGTMICIITFSKTFTGLVNDGTPIMTIPVAFLSPPSCSLSRVQQEYDMHNIKWVAESTVSPDKTKVLVYGSSTVVYPTTTTECSYKITLIGRWK